ncbi:MAG: hypothetical protein ACRD3C_19030 [Vicinamibacterales bacterium]
MTSLATTRAQFSEDDLVPGLIFIVLAALACMTPAQNDTFWHLRSGQQMWQTGSLLLTEPFSYTAYGAELHNHWWLSQLAFYAVHSLGGPFLLTLVAGACAVAAIAGSWRLIRGSWELRVALLAWLLVATAPEWAVRPQVISLALLVLVAHLIARGRLVWVPLVCVVWANAHALVIFGVVMGAAVLLEALVWSRAEVRRAATIAAACALAPMLSPLGWSYWSQVLTTVSVSQELQIQEYQMPLRPSDLPFWAALGTLIVVAIVQRHRLAALERADRILLLGALVLAGAAATAARNVAFFAVIAGPALSRAWPPHATAARRRFRPLGAVARGMCLTAAVVGAVVVFTRWRDGGVRVGWQPMSPAAVGAVRRCPDPIFNQMVDGGFLMWALPGRRVFVDSRMEAYPLPVLRASREADLHGEYETVFRQYGINCAIVGAASPLFERLTEDSSMKLTYSDVARSVFIRTGPAGP